MPPMIGYNHAKAKAAAAAIDKADELAVEAAIQSAKSKANHTETKGFQNEKYLRKISNDNNECSIMSDSDAFSTGSTPISKDSSAVEDSPAVGGIQIEATEDAWTCSHCKHFHPTFKFRCGNCTRYNMMRDETVDENIDLIDGKTSRVSHHNHSGKDVTNDDEKKSRLFDESNNNSSFDGDQELSRWKCPKCKHIETTSSMRCSNCKEEKSGNMPTKELEANKETEDSEEFEFTMSQDEEITTSKKPIVAKKKTPPLSIASKKNLKPLFEINDQVYAPWWEDDEHLSDPSWYAGVITNYITISSSKYGPVRQYDVIFVDDDEEMIDIEDSFIFSREDYLLTTSGKEWIGVETKFDKDAGDPWAEIVGWYDALIGEFLLC